MKKAKGKKVAQNKFMAAEEKYDEKESKKAISKKKPLDIGDALNKAMKGSKKKPMPKASKK